MTLYEIQGDYQNWIYALENAESEEERAAIMNEMQITSDNLVDKAAAYAKCILNEKADITALTDEIIRLDKIRDRKADTVKHLTDAVKNCMDTLDIKKIETPIGKFTRRLNPYSCDVVNENEVPQQYLIEQKPKVDKRKILADFKETGEIIPGCVFDRSTSISFK